jgi:hypothetical protein
MDPDQFNFLIQETKFIQKFFFDKEDFDLIGQKILMPHFKNIINPETLLNILEKPNPKADLYLEFAFLYLKLINSLSELRYLNSTLCIIKNLNLEKIYEIS